MVFKQKKSNTLPSPIVICSLLSGIPCLDWSGETWSSGRFKSKSFFSNLTLANAGAEAQRHSNDEQNVIYYYQTKDWLFLCPLISSIHSPFLTSLYRPHSLLSTKPFVWVTQTFGCPSCKAHSVNRKSHQPLPRRWVASSRSGFSHFLSFEYL